MLPWKPSIQLEVTICLVVTLVFSGCGGGTLVSPTSLRKTPAVPDATAPAADGSTAIANEPTVSLPPLSAGSHILVGAGDISMCALEGAALTASLMERLLRQAQTTGITLGDNSNDNGSRDNVTNCFDRTWGRFKGQLMPSPGNHDYEAEPGNPYYFEYFGANAGPSSLGYYSYDRGNWHIVSLNTEVSDAQRQAQTDWLSADLRAHPNTCTLAYFHRPLFSSGEFASRPRARNLWNVLYRYGVDVVLNGHEHFYAAFPPLDPTGARDERYGITQIIAGTGGARLFDRPAATYGETIIAGQWGVLAITLDARAYTWRFMSVDGAQLDSGAGTCHAAPPAPA
jgi:acid phosphatase type 7